jgi:hypothetical protein
VKELQAVTEFPFAVLPKPSEFFQPSEGAFDDPSFGQDDKSVQFIALDDLDGGFQTLFDAIGEGLAGVAAAGQTDSLSTSDREVVAISGSDNTFGHLAARRPLGRQLLRYAPKPPTQPKK